MRIVLGVPVYDSVEFNACASLVALVHEWPRLRPGDDLAPIFVRGQPASFARNAIAAEAVRLGADAILWSDSDVSLDDPQDYARLLTTYAASATEYALCGAPCVVQESRGAFTTNVACLPRGAVVSSRDPFEVAAVGFGLVVLRVAALATIPQPWFEFVSDPFTGKPKIGEDIGLCDKLRAAGHRILCEPRVRPRHHFRRGFAALGDETLAQLLSGD